VLVAKLSLGDQELEVLRFITERPGITVRGVAREFGDPRGLARTTLLTVMENLRAKGYLTRKRGLHAYEYSPTVSRTELMQQLVGDFVRNTLKGSVSPVAAYLAGAPEISDEELAELEAVLERLRAERRREP
jgi:predicted transcriptional regulator